MARIDLIWSSSAYFTASTIVMASKPPHERFESRFRYGRP
jgi:hypothetical protein